MFCDQCGKELKDGARFCAGCGLAVAGGTSQSGLLDRRGGAHEGHYKKVRRYSCDADAFANLFPTFTKWLDSAKFDSQILQTQEGKTLVQVSKRGGWRKLIGMSTALNVLFDHDGSALTVEIGAGRWIDKAAVGTVSLFILWPLAVTAAIGVWKQMKMPEKVFAYINQELGNRK